MNPDKLYFYQVYIGSYITDTVIFTRENTDTANIDAYIRTALISSCDGECNSYLFRYCKHGASLVDGRFYYQVANVTGYTIVEIDH